MAYPTGVLSVVLEDIDRRIINLKTYAQTHRAALAAGNTDSARIIGVFRNLRTERAALTQAASTPGLAPFARDQKNNQTLDVVAEFNALVAAIDGVTGWIETNFPKDANGFLLGWSLNAGSVVERQFTPAQTAGLRTQLETLIAAIA